MARYDNYLFTQKESIDSNTKNRYYQSLLDPTIEKDATDIYVITTIGDRYDLLAWKYYGDAELWWIISAANPELQKDSLYLEPGTQIRIPRDYQKALTTFQEQNSLR
jgi:phage tail protein X